MSQAIVYLRVSQPVGNGHRRWDVNVFKGSCSHKLGHGCVTGVTVHMGQGVIVLWGTCSHRTGCDCVIGVTVHTGQGVTVL